MTELALFHQTLPGPGLSSAEVADRVARGLVNRIPHRHVADYLQIVRRNLFTLFNALVLPAALALALLGEYPGAIAVSGLALFNSAVGLAQEIRAKWHLDRLALLSEPMVRVVRDGTPLRVAAGDVVCDDYLLLAAGEAVIADGTVVASRHLEVDEALLTGESDPVAAAIGRQLLSGSFCVAGEGVYRAERVGSGAYAQQTGMEARRYDFRDSPLQRTVNQLIQILTSAAIVLCLLYVLLYFVRGFSTTDLVQMVAATITSMVPQGLVLMTTLAFILGAVRMSARGAIVQRLSAVESMAAINILCLDKTGTLTTNRLKLQQVRILTAVENSASVERLLALFAWGSMDEQNKTVAALRIASGGEPGDRGTVVDRLPFKSQNRFSAVRLQNQETPEREDLVLVLGACEAIAPLLASGKESWQAALEELLPSGLRVLMLARGVTAEVGRGFQDLLPQMALAPVALVALSDELRPDAAKVLGELTRSGIGLKIISGDHPDTVLATVRQLGLALDRGDVITGAEFAAAADADDLAARRTVFARVAPRQKVEIIAALQRQKKQVAMVGDGVNDLLAIKRADLGIALGEGSMATRTVAGLVLENNRFDLLPATLAEGRNILRNLRRVGKVLLVKNVYTLLLIVATLGVFRLDFPYLPQQVTLLNKLTITIPVFVITLGRLSGARSTHQGFLWDVGRFALQTGVVMGLAGLATLLLSAWYLGDPLPAQRSMLISTLIILALGNLPRILAGDGEILSLMDRHFLWWVPLSVVIYASVLYWPAAATFFQLSPLGLYQCGVVLAVSCPALLLCYALDIVWRKSSPGS